MTDLLTEARDALGHAIATIKAHVPVDAIGFGGNPLLETQWPIRDEYLFYMESALAKLDAAIKENNS